MPPTLPPLETTLNTTEITPAFPPPPASTPHLSSAVILCAFHMAHLDNTQIPPPTFCGQILYRTGTPTPIQSIAYRVTDHTLNITLQPTPEQPNPHPIHITTATDSYKYSFLLHPLLQQSPFFRFRHPPQLQLPLKDLAQNPAAHPRYETYTAPSCSPSYFDLSASTTHQVLHFYLPFIPAQLLQAMPASLQLTLQPYWPSAPSPLRTTFPFALSACLYAPHAFSASCLASAFSASCSASSLVNIPLSSFSDTTSTPLQLPHDTLLLIAQAFIFDINWPLLSTQWTLVSHSHTPSPTIPLYPLAHTSQMLIHLESTDSISLLEKSSLYSTSDPHTSSNPLFLDTNILFELSENLSMLYDAPSPDPLNPPTPLPPPDFLALPHHLTSLLVAKLSC